MSYIDEYTENEKKRLSSPERVKARIRDLEINKKQWFSKINNPDGNGDLKTDTENYLNFIQGVADELDEEEIEDSELKEKLKNAWEYMSYHFNPLFVPVYFVNLCMDMAGLAKDAFMLMLENMKPKANAEPEVDPNKKFFGIENEKGRGREKSFENENDKKAKSNRKDVEKTKNGVTFDQSYANEMKAQKEKEAKDAKEYGEKIARETTRNAGIFASQNGKGSGKDFDWGNDGNIFADAPSYEPSYEPPTFGR